MVSVSMRGHCPNCNSPLTADELSVNPPICPTCKAELQVLIKANWVYAVLSVAVASIIAGLQGYESIVFAFWVLIYGTIVLFLIKFYRWELHLPIKIVAVPNCQLWPKDTL
jgi:uncharacterized protein (DUF983 family)